jgi:hypothetical protein
LRGSASLRLLSPVSGPPRDRLSPRRSSISVSLGSDGSACRSLARSRDRTRALLRGDARWRLGRIPQTRGDHRPCGPCGCRSVPLVDRVAPSPACATAPRHLDADGRYINV